MKRLAFVALQIVFVGSFAFAWNRLTPVENDAVEELVTGVAPVPSVEVARNVPRRVEPLYDDPEVVSDEELAIVLERVRPMFGWEKMKPNHVEHALRTWGVDATFDDPQCTSGDEMVEVLTNHAQYLISWSKSKRLPPPLLVDTKDGIHVRWDKRGDGSVHHDHWLASLTEAGITLDHPVHSAGRKNATIETVLQEALRDFRVDEREVEWSAMAFGFWLPPEVKQWHTSDGRRMDFDLIAERLMRGDQKYGVCNGTHRVYSLMMLWRLDREHDILSDEVAAKVWSHLEFVREMITRSQHEEGYWHEDWSRGQKALLDPVTDPQYEYRKIIATGHHLEWLAFAPEELHPPREQILKAADWIIAEIQKETPETIKGKYTFYSHVGSALAAWRKTRPYPAWRKWRETHPYVAPAEDEPQPESETTPEPEPATEPDPQPMGDDAPTEPTDTTDAPDELPILRAPGVADDDAE